MPTFATLHVDPEVTELLDVEEVVLEEQLCRCFALSVVIRTKNPSLDVSAMVGHRTWLDLPDEPILKRVEGVIRSVELRSSEASSDGAGLSKYLVEIVPAAWLLSKRSDHRIFQNMSRVEVAVLVLSSNPNVPAVELRTDARAHAKDEYVVQYAENDLAFVERMLAQAGAPHFFDHPNASRLTIVNDTTNATPLLPPIPFAPPTALEQDLSQPRVWNVSFASRVATGGVLLRDYDYRKPAFALQAFAQGATHASESAIVSYEFAVGDFQDQATGDELAKRTLHDLRRGFEELSCTSSFGVGAGTRFVLTGHPRDDLAREWLVVASRLHIRAELDQIKRNGTIRAVDASTPLRPSRIARPRIHGTHTAIVVGEMDGQEIDIDALGRVLVKLHWDRRGNATSTTRRVRVSQSWAGPGYGLLTVPRIGDEVLISYLDGDPDEPVLIGRLHNAVNVPPLNLPAEQTRSTWRSRSTPGGGGFNEIMLEDKKGEELVFVRAERDHHTFVQRNASTKIGVHASTEIGGNQQSAVVGSSSGFIGGTEDLEVQGDAWWAFGGDLTVDVAGVLNEDAYRIYEQSTQYWNDAEEHDFKSRAIFRVHAMNIEERALGTVTVSGTVVTIEASAVIKLQVGASSIVMTAGTITMNSPLIDLNPG